MMSGETSCGGAGSTMASLSELTPLSEVSPTAERSAVFMSGLRSISRARCMPPTPRRAATAYEARFPGTERGWVGLQAPPGPSKSSVLAVKLPPAVANTSPLRMGRADLGGGLEASLTAGLYTIKRLCRFADQHECCEWKDGVCPVQSPRRTSLRC